MFTTTCCRRMVVQRIVSARLHHVVNVMDVGRNHDSNKGASGSRHNYLLSYANHSRELSTEWRIFTSALIWALISDPGKILIPLSPTIFFSFYAALPQAHSFIHVACPINSAPSLTKSNTACPPPSALSLPKSFLLDCNSWRQTHIVSWCDLEHFMDMIFPFPQSSFFSVLGQVDGACLLRQNDLPEVDGTSACSRCPCVRACTIIITAEADPVQVSL